MFLQQMSYMEVGVWEWKSKWRIYKVESDKWDPLAHFPSRGERKFIQIHFGILTYNFHLWNKYISKWMSISMHSQKIVGPRNLVPGLFWPWSGKLSQILKNHPEDGLKIRSPRSFLLGNYDMSQTWKVHLED